MKFVHFCLHCAVVEVSFLLVVASWYALSAYFCCTEHLTVHIVQQTFTLCAAILAPSIIMDRVCVWCVRAHGVYVWCVRGVYVWCVRARMPQSSSALECVYNCIEKAMGGCPLSLPHLPLWCWFNGGTDCCDLTTLPVTCSKHEEV